MSSKVFSSVNVNDIVNASEEGNGGTVTATGAAVGTFDNFNFVATNTISSAVPGATVDVWVNVELTGTIDYADLFGIPAGATISKIKLTASIQFIGNANQSGGDSVDLTFDSLYSIGTEIEGYHPTTISDPNGATWTPSTHLISIIKIFPEPISRDQLIAEYSVVSLDVFGGATAFTGGAGTGDATASLTGSDWRLEITYQAGPVSWYVKPKTIIVGGLPIQVPDESVPPIEVPDGELPPEEFIEVGPELIYYWWVLEEDEEEDEEKDEETEEERRERERRERERADLIARWFTFIRSRIPPGAKWKKLNGDGIGPPSCVGCRSIMLGELEILIADASGIYVLEAGKRTDTLYFREDGETTRDVRIPEPSAKTGFLP